MKERTPLAELGRWAAAAAIWMAAWLAFTGSVKVPELLVGAAAAAVSATLSVTAFRARIVRARVLPSTLLPAARVAGDVVVGTARIFVELVRALAYGRFLVRLADVPFEAGEDATEAETRRAAAITLATLSPDTLVLGLDGDRLIYHQLGRGPVPTVIRDLEVRR